MTLYRHLASFLEIFANKKKDLNIIIVAKILLPIIATNNRSLEEQLFFFHIFNTAAVATMIFRRPKSYSITLQRAHSLLKIPRDASNTTLIQSSTNNTNSVCTSLSRDQIQHAFREAAKRYHPDIIARSGGDENVAKKSLETAAAMAAPLSKEANTTIRECYEARELLLDYYIRKTYIHPEIIQSMNDKPRDKYADETWFSVWRNERSFQIEVFLRLSFCLALAIGTYYHDLYLPERRKQQIQRRDAEFNNFGPRW
jgi:hypothetical protein